MEQPLDQTSKWFLILLLVLLVFLALRPFVDPDFWWHLASGREMVAQGGLLSLDPFTSFPPPSGSARTDQILISYWIWQLAYYAVYAFAGFWGLHLLNGLVLLTLFWVVWLRMRRLKVPLALALFCISLSLPLFIAHFPPERPQSLTFIFAAILLGMFEQIRSGKHPHWGLIPMMVLWANVHGGFLVGVVFLALFLFGMFFDLGGLRNPQWRKIAIWTACGLVATLFRPGGWSFYAQVIDFFFVSTTFQQTTQEYFSTFWFFREADQRVILLWLLIVLYLFGLVMGRERRLTDWLFFIFIAWQSIAHMRYVPFFSVVLLPNVASSMRFVLKSKSAQRAIVGLSMIVVVMLIAAQVFAAQRTNFGAGIQYPEKLIIFLQEENIAGNMLNEYKWGGYFDWRIYPKYQVFIDGRGLSKAIYDDYLSMISASSRKVDGRPEYLVLLDRYQIQFLVVKNRQIDGSVNPLMAAVLQESDWHPVYVGELSCVLIREDSQNRAIFEKYPLTRDAVLSKLLEDSNTLVRLFPNNPDSYIGRADVLILMGRKKEAERDLMMVERMVPSSRALSRLRNHR